MKIIVRNMVYADIEQLSRAFAGQGWAMPAQVFETYYSRMLRRYCDMLVAEARGRRAGFARLEWVDAGEEADHALMPELQEFVVLNAFTGTGVAEAMNAELERRVQARTGGMENAMMAVYGDAPLRPAAKSSYVLDGLLINGDGKFVRSRGAARAPGSRIIQRILK